MLNYSNLWRYRFQGKMLWFCPPAARRNTSKDEDSEKIDKVRSALGLCYKPVLHYALGHMRLWDGAYPPLAADNLLAEDDKPRSVLLADLIMKIIFAYAQVCAAQKRPSVRVQVF
jgi:hypothetical protein